MVLVARIALVVILLIPQAAAAVTVDLRTANPFAIQAVVGITNTGASTVNVRTPAACRLQAGR